MSPGRVALALAPLVAACGCNAIAGIDPPVYDPCFHADGGPACAGAGQGGGGSGGGGPASTASAVSTGAGVTGGGPPAPFCGDSHADPGEECDDGNDVPGDGCTGCRVDCAGPGAFLDPLTFHCYRFVAMPAETWSAARDACAGPRAHLATLTSIAELSVVAPHVPGHAWIDGVRREAAYAWDDGEAWSFAAWKSGAPPFDDHKACVKLDGGAFDVDDCATKMAFVCETDPAGR